MIFKHSYDLYVSRQTDRSRTIPFSIDLIYSKMCSYDIACRIPVDGYRDPCIVVATVSAFTGVQARKIVEDELSDLGFRCESSSIRRVGRNRVVTRSGFARPSLSEFPGNKSDVTRFLDDELALPVVESEADLDRMAAYLGKRGLSLYIKTAGGEMIAV